MTRVLVAIDGSDVTIPVAEVGRVLADHLGHDLDVVHVTSPAAPGERPPVDVDRWTRALGDLGVGPVRMVPGERGARLIDEASAPDVAMVVVGSGRREGGPDEPAVGRIARLLLEGVPTPTAVVPPRSSDAPVSAPARVLVAVEAERPDDEVLAVIDRFLAVGSTVTVVHVLGAGRVPVFEDHPEHQLEAWGREFLTRFGRSDCHLLLRRGVAWNEVSACAGDVGADLLVVGWAGHLTPGHAAFVRQALEHADLPLLLVPVRGPSR